jgi:competence protein ComEC
VHGLPRTSPVGTRFDFDLAAVAAVPGCPGPGPRRVRVTWYEPPPIESGDAWVLELSLRALRNHDNPGAFDYVAWAAGQRIDASATVRRGARDPAAARWRLDGSVVDRVRAAVGARIASSGATHPALLTAFAVGDARAITAPQWELFRRTGTIHLVVVSGLHIAIATACGLALGRLAARAWPQRLRRRGEQGCAAITAAVATVCYSLLAGFTVPVARACVCALLALLWWSSARSVPGPRLLGIALLVLLLVDPGGLRDPSLWLSFGATAILVAYFAPRRGLPWSSGWLRVQCVLTVAMLPVLVASVGQVAWVSVVANLIAVPLVSLVAIPLMLAALALMPVCAAFADVAIGLADIACDVLMAFLGLVANAAVTDVADVDPPLLILSIAAAALALLPLRATERLCLMPALLLPLAIEPPSVPFGEARVVVLDVGQGLSVVVDSARHRLLYDTGAWYPSGFDVGASVVVPAVAATGAMRADLVVVSHGDIDHSGGYAAVRARVAVRSTLSGAPQLVARACRRGQSWQWDGVRFLVLGPATAPGSDNDGSCVLSVRASSGRALLPGDVGSAGERALLDVHRALASDLLVAPHHGSGGSSSPAFIAAVAPRWVAFSAGLGNRFRHPHPNAIGRYTERGVAWRSTATAGALTWRSDRPHLLTPWRGGRRAGRPPDGG